MKHALNRFESFVPRKVQGRADSLIGKEVAATMFLFDEVEFIEDVECEVFKKQSQKRGSLEIINKGEYGDVFEIINDNLIGVQFGNGEVVYVDKKFLKKI